MGTGMELRVLGPLEVLDDGRHTPLGSRRVRTVLGFLLLHPHEAVPLTSLTHALWPVGEPVTARRMVYGAVSALRSVLPSGRAGLSVSATGPSAEGGGYLLEVPPGSLDLLGFRHEAARGRRELAAADWASAAATLRRALDLWRGDVLADLDSACALWPEREAVREERWAALLGRLTADLALGRHHEVVRELTVVAEEQPGRVRLTALLMLALYRVGRHVDALAVYRRTREAVVLSTGREPCEELRRLQRAVLTHDRSLLAPYPLFHHAGEPTRV
ncbi:AfsR/SARP family transcriptional regulator [Streptomyces yaizuensis]|uniref:AfsR/SARP family transcriptional regulator n=2 Tax=Streptomyces yaizuensis TaxID=2989713 RepID=A0ABQ5NSB6_9ACTN|nr:AfsR/SARP family transcriptional regulator [Streptomyces sp. YSPA8]